MGEKVGLRRALGLPLLTFYGLGTIVGAGIYVLVGKVAATAGMLAPLAFVLAAAVAGLTAVAYAELSARFPKSAGEAVYAEAAFGRRWLTRTVGWAVVIVGSISAAAIANGFVGYLGVFMVLPGWVVITLLVSILGALACLGIGQSVGVAAAITVLELGGLVLVISVAGPSLVDLPERWAEAGGTAQLLGATTVGAEASTGAQTGLHAVEGVLLGAVLAFYAFIGFEDMVNVAEEVKAPSRTLPKAIFIAVGCSTVLYLLVSMVAISALDLEVLANSEAPLADIVAARGYDPRYSIGLISLLAVVNGALIQIIMAARVMYGLSQVGSAPAVFGEVHPRWQTPVKATVVVSVGVCGLALWFPIEMLARLASVVTLCIFIIVDLSLVWLRFNPRAPQPAPGLPAYPLVFAVTGALAAAGMLLWQVLAWLR